MSLDTSLSGVTCWIFLLFSCRTGWMPSMSIRPTAAATVARSRRWLEMMRKRVVKILRQRITWLALSRWVKSQLCTEWQSETLLYWAEESWAFYTTVCYSAGGLAQFWGVCTYFSKCCAIQEASASQLKLECEVSVFLSMVKNRENDGKSAPNIEGIILYVT